MREKRKAKTEEVLTEKPVKKQKRKTSKEDTTSTRSSARGKACTTQKNASSTIAAEKKPRGKTTSSTGKNKTDQICKKSEGSTDNGEMIVMKIPSLIRATVVNRPSKVVKSPYMADILLPGASEPQLCHSPALGCSGLIVPGSQVFVTPKSSAAAKSKYSLDLIDLGYTVVGANPNFCNKMVRFALEKGWIEGLPKFDPKEIKGEVTVDESRFDFKCIQNETVYYVEVKGVPNASPSDPPKPKPKAKKRKEGDLPAEEEESIPGQLISYFPDGYRKAPNDPISPRALKHVQHLQRLCTEQNTVCALVFVVQRSDCKRFQPTKGDPIYRKAVYEAAEAGVLVIPHSLSWRGSAAHWNPRMEMNLKDETDPY